jgi:glycosidase
MKRNYIYHLFVSHGDKRYGFANSIEGIINQLDYIQDMGFNLIMVNPLFKSEDYHGYTIQNFYDISDELGGMEAFDKLIKELEKRNMGLVFDITLAHSSREHKYFKDFLQGKNDFYILRDEIENDIASDMHPTCHFYQEDLGKHLVAAFGDWMPSLNVESEAYREEIANVIRFWLSKSKCIHMRLDAILHARTTAKGHNSLPFVQFIRDVANEVNPDALLISEVWTNTNLKNEPKAFADISGAAFDFQTSFHILGEVKYGKTFDEVHIEEYNSQHNFVNFLGNHDTTRLKSILDEDENKVRIALKVLFEKTTGDISLYYGDELGYSGHVINGNDRDVRKSIDYVDMAYAIKNKDSLFHYIKNLISEDKKRRCGDK